MAADPGAVTDRPARPKAPYCILPEGEDYPMHVIPMFGPAHTATADCWCRPEHDPEDPLVMIHHVPN